MMRLQDKRGILSVFFERCILFEDENWSFNEASQVSNDSNKWWSIARNAWFLWLRSGASRRKETNINLWNVRSPDDDAVWNYVYTCHLLLVCVQFTACHINYDVRRTCMCMAWSLDVWRVCTLYGKYAFCNTLFIVAVIILFLYLFLY